MGSVLTCGTARRRLPKPATLRPGAAWLLGLVLLGFGLSGCSGSADSASEQGQSGSTTDHQESASPQQSPPFRQADLATVDWAPFEAATVAPEERLLAPQFTLQSVKGDPVSLGSYRGKVVLVNFWATWCGPCRKEIPDFIGMTQTYEDEDFVILGVSMDKDGLAKVQPFVRNSGINYPILVGGPRISPLYGNVTSIPTTFVIDKRGRIAARARGYRPRGHFEGIVKSLLEET